MVCSTHDWFAHHGQRYRARTAALFAEGNSLDRRAVNDGLAEAADLRSKLHGTMDDLGIDVWLSPATTGPNSLAVTPFGRTLCAHDLAFPFRQDVGDR